MIGEMGSRHQIYTQIHSPSGENSRGHFIREKFTSYDASFVPKVNRRVLINIRHISLSFENQESLNRALTHYELFDKVGLGAASQNPIVAWSLGIVISIAGSESASESTELKARVVTVVA